MTEVVIGIDVGTTSVKAVALDLSGRPVSEGRSAIRWTTCPTGAEADPEDFITATLIAAHGAAADVRDVEVVALGVTSMGETGVLLDGRGVPVAPCVAWHDRRGAAAARDAVASMGRERFAQITGLPPSAGWSAFTYKWLVEHQDRASQGVTWLSIAEWIVHRLGGDRVSELSLASRTGFLDVPAGTVSDDMLAWAGAPAGLLGDLVCAGTAVGRVDAEHGDLRGAVLTVAGHDHLVACVGMDAVRRNDVVDSCGTAEALVATVDDADPRLDVVGLAAQGATVGRHVLPGRRAVLAAAFTGLGMSRVLLTIGEPLPVAPELDARAAPLVGSSGRPRVVIDRDGTAHLHDLTDHLDHAAIFSAAAESAAATGAELLDIVAVGTGTPRVVAGGGWTRLETVRRAKARAVPGLQFAADTEPGARGAALLAAQAAGVAGDLAPAGGHAAHGRTPA